MKNVHNQNIFIFYFIYKKKCLEKGIPNAVVKLIVFKVINEPTVMMSHVKTK
jgi:hypothetical protein